MCFRPDTNYRRPPGNKALHGPQWDKIKIEMLPLSHSLGSIALIRCCPDHFKEWWPGRDKFWGMYKDNEPEFKQGVFSLLMDHCSQHYGEFFDYKASVGG